MSKHLPNCPHLSEYDGLGSAGILMALNKKWGDRTPGDNHDSYTYIEDTTNKKDISMPNRRKLEKMIKCAFIKGYNLRKEDESNNTNRSYTELGKIALDWYWSKIW